MLGMSFKKLQIWQKAMELANLVYQFTKVFPREEVYGLTSQMRRAAVSIASNIAEGSQRTSDKEFANFVLISKGSVAELETQTMLALAQKLAPTEEKTGQEILLRTEELSKMLYSFHSKLLAQDS